MLLISLFKNRINSPKPSRFAIQDSLSKLSELSEKLNTETDSLNEVIEHIDAQLAQMGVGVSVWDNELLEHTTHEIH